MTVDVALPTLDWDQARVFLAVAKTGQLAAAAARLGLDVSTVSRRLDRIEAQLGVHLFDRTREGTVMTAAAELMVPAAEAMERAMADFVGSVAQVETEVEGVVRLTSPPGFADAFVAPLLARFHALHPRVCVELDASVAYADLTRREADLAIRLTRPTSGDLLVTKLVATRSLPLTSPEYSEQLGRLKRFEDARWIAWDADLAHLPVARWITSNLAGAPPVLRTSNFASQLAAAVAGLGIVVAPEPYRHVRRLVPVSLAPALRRSFEEIPADQLWLVGHRALRNVPRVAALWEFLLDHLSRPEKIGDLIPPG
ncbi:LysR family transcriptional regulator [Myxococcota bacterium]|nr:LysR family transcriptional regulator [Myxococcota bacterium]